MPVSKAIKAVICINDFGVSTAIITFFVGGVSWTLDSRMEAANYHTKLTKKFISVAVQYSFQQQFHIDQRRRIFHVEIWIIQTYSFFKSHLVVQIWTAVYVEYFVNIDQKIGQKIQVKAKFPQVVITNIRTLPPVFSKTFWTAAWRKTPDGCFWHYVCKSIYSCSRKVALTVFTEMCFTTFFKEIKMLLYSKKFSGNWQRKCCFRKFDHHMKA